MKNHGTLVSVFQGFLSQPCKIPLGPAQSKTTDSLGCYHGSKTALAVAKTRKTLKVLPETLKLTSGLEQSTVELTRVGMVSVHFTLPTRDEPWPLKLYMVSVRPWPESPTVLYKIDKDFPDILKLI